MQTDKEKVSKKPQSVLMQMIKRMNGFKENTFKELDKIDTIQLVLEDFGDMNCIHRFKGLKSLTLINCGIVQVAGLQDAVRLEKLWLNENQISKISGFQNCVSLKALYLSHNRISHLQGLESLKSLQTFWICDNKIQSMNGLQNLISLKQLWIAGNQIDCIKTTLDNLINLHDLNISGNKICSFKQVLNLNRVPNLKILSFYDPHFGQNPICNLCNYQTYILYHFRNITRLDTLTITEDAKTYAESTLMRKKMYYNMRIKTIERSFSTLSKLVQKSKKIKIDSLNQDLANLFLKINDIGESDLELQKIYEGKKQEVTHVQDIYESINKKLRDINKNSIRKLLTEFETGGNIRLQEGKPSQRWYSSCIDLVKSRYQPQDLQKYGISGFHIKRALKIHNRFLKNKFEQKMQMLADISLSTSKKQLQYLFYGLDPNTPSQLGYVIQQGFRTPQEAKKLGVCPFVPLVNSLMLADLPRISQCLQQKNKKGQYMKKKGIEKLPLIPSSSLLICKVLMKEQIDTTVPYFNPTIPPSTLYNQGTIEYQEGHYALRRSYEPDNKYKIWYIMDPTLVLPEYLIEYDYILKDDLQNKVADFGETVGLLQNQDEFLTAKNIGKYEKEINMLYNTLVGEISNYQFQNIQDIHGNLQIQANQLDRLDLSSLKVYLVNYFKYCVSRSELYSQFNENFLYQGTEDFDPNKFIKDPEALKFANLSNLKIKNFSFISTFNNLETLVLSYSSVVELSFLQSLNSIKKLDLSHNHLTCVTSINCLPLEHINLSHNQISETKDLQILEVCKGYLRQVNVLFNPLRREEETYIMLIQCLGNLMELNHIPKSRFHQIKIQENHQTEITDDILKDNCKIMQSKTLETSDWKLSIESVTLTYMKLSSMQGLQNLVNVRQINLSNNFIKQIDGIDCCKLLQELNLQKNWIRKIQKLEGLVYLKKVELGANNISKIEGISTLNNLQQLSLEDNKIQSLQNFPNLRTLMQLYLGNNKIGDIKQVKNLTQLGKLIILDLSGNVMAKEDNYRYYTLYNVKKLKILDGISVEDPETRQAREHFTGRLTQEILSDNLKGYACNQVLELQLKDCKLKDFQEMFNNRIFPLLTQLDLSGNEFSSVKMLGYLPNLKILILQANKIQTLSYNSDMAILKGMNGCHNLQILDISSNQLRDFYGLHLCKLSQLKILKASKNQIMKIDCLQNLKQLKQLDINHNKVRQLDVNSFEGKLPIKVLKIDDNGLKNFLHIQKLLRLQHLFANSNKITQFYDIQKLTELPYLKQLELTGNILYRKPGYRITMLKKLPNLLYLDGREITGDQRSEPMTVMHPMTQVHGQTQNVPPLNTKGQVPVRLSSVNFQGVFASSRLQMQSLISKGLYKDQDKDKK